MTHRTLALLAVACGGLAAPLAAQRPDAARVRAVADSAAAASLAGGRGAGLVIAVVRGADTLVMQGYGKADLEWDVPMPADAIFEIGSVTKQFTSAVILQLADEGKLSLDDELTRVLPDYPTQGHRVTLRRLLDHTSGIASYTELKEFRPLSRRTLPRDSLVALFAAKPFDFAPGEMMKYNNSAFFLLGLVIEKVTGQPYAEAVRTRLLEPAGMRDTRYCDEGAVLPRRANGYDQRPAGLQQAEFLVQLWPYAAGSLCSTAADLVRWNAALHGGRLLSSAAYAELVTPGTLANGRRLRYAKGLAVDSLHGQVTRHHSGGINGFQSELRWFPRDSVSIVVLSNAMGGPKPGAIASALGEALFGVPATAPVAQPWQGTPADYAGIYASRVPGGLSLKIVADSAGTGLVAVAAPPPGARFVPLGGERFELAGAAFTGARAEFVRTDGRVTGLWVDQVGFQQFLARRPPPSAAR